MFPYGPLPTPPDQPPDPQEQPPEADEPTVGDMEDFERIARDPVLSWRATRLVQAGLNPRQARALALDRSVEKEFVIERLLARGCPPDTAFDIAS